MLSFLFIKQIIELNNFCNFSVDVLSDWGGMLIMFVDGIIKKKLNSIQVWLVGVVNVLRHCLFYNLLVV